MRQSGMSIINRFIKSKSDPKFDHEAQYQEALKKFLEKGGEIKKVKVTHEFIIDSLKPKKRVKAPKNNPRKKK